MTRVFVVSRSPAVRARLAARCRAAGLDVVGEGPSLPHPADVRVQVIVAPGDEDDLELELEEGEVAALLLVSDSPAAAARASRTGAGGWAVVPGDAALEDLAAAAAAAARGFAVVPNVVRPGADSPSAEGDGDTHEPLRRRSAPPDDVDAPDVVEPLTPRERDILELLALGHSNRAIAGALGISEHTVKFHLASIYGKLGASTRTEAVRLALRRGLIAM